MQSKSWLLPEGIDELLPDEAAALEQLRRNLLDSYVSWGYQLVMPPFIEYLDSLLTGTGKDLKKQTFQLIDQLNGEQLGIRADITPQVARIDSHQLRSKAPTRLCYVGSVLRTRLDGFSSSRSPLQIGAELYGHNGLDSDAEILNIMAETLNIAGIENYFLDIGHVGILRSLAKQAKLNSNQESVMFDALQRKAKVELSELTREFGLSKDSSEMFTHLADLNGGIETLDRAKKLLNKAPRNVMEDIDYLKNLTKILQQRMPEVPLHFDLAELRAYRFHTGVVFAAFFQGQGNEIARGGRYDDIGEKFGRARPATGFSSDLKALLKHGSKNFNELGPKILAPSEIDSDLESIIKSMREKGSIIIYELEGQSIDAEEMGISKKFSKTKNGWEIVPF